MGRSRQTALIKPKRAVRSFDRSGRVVNLQPKIDLQKKYYKQRKIRYSNLDSLSFKEKYFIKRYLTKKPGNVFDRKDDTGRLVFKPISNVTRKLFKATQRLSKLKGQYGIDIGDNSIITQRVNAIEGLIEPNADISAQLAEEEICRLLGIAPEDVQEDLPDLYQPEKVLHQNNVKMLPKSLFKRSEWFAFEKDSDDWDIQSLEVGTELYYFINELRYQLSDDPDTMIETDIYLDFTDDNGNIIKRQTLDDLVRDCYEQTLRENDFAVEQQEFMESMIRKISDQVYNLNGLQVFQPAPVNAPANPETIIELEGTGNKEAASWDGQLGYQEIRHDKFYMPTSRMCTLKCLREYVLIQSKSFIAVPGSEQLYQRQLKKIDLLLEGKQLSRSSVSTNQNKYNPKPQQAYDSMSIKRLTKLCRDNELLEIPTLTYDESNKCFIDKKNKQKRMGIFNIKTSFYNLGHAVLIKDPLCTLEEISEQVRLNPPQKITERDLSKTTKVSYAPKTSEPTIAYMFDIETYNDYYTKQLGLKDTKHTVTIGRQKEYVVSFERIDLDALSKKTMPIKYPNQVLIGDNCIGDMLTQLARIHSIDNLITGELKQKKIILYSFNGSKFDTLFAKHLVDVQIKPGTIKCSTGLKKLCVTVKDVANSPVFDMRDLKLLLAPGCLSQYLNDFGCTNKIGFDIKDKSKLWYERSCQYNIRYDSHGNAIYSDTGLDADNKQIPNINEHKLECSTVIDYCRQDTSSIVELGLKMNEYFNKLGFDIRDYLTISSAAYNMMLKTCFEFTNNTFIPTDPITSHFIRASIYGGRVFCWKRYNIDAQGKPEYLLCEDINSLYPSALLEYFPTGKPFEIEKTKPNQTLQELMTELYEKGKLFIANCRVVYPNTKYPLMPYRTEDKHVIYPVGTFEGVYTSVAITEAIIDGATVEFLPDESGHIGVYWKTKSRMFKKLVEELYSLRLQLKKQGSSFEVVIKLILNSMYGKMLQHIKSKVYINNNPKPAYHLCKANHKPKTKQLKNGQYEHTFSEVLDEEEKKPYHLAPFILDYSKQIVNRVIRSVGKENVYYSDTDSLYIPARLEYKIKQFLDDTKLGFMKNDYGTNPKLNKDIINPDVINPDGSITKGSITKGTIDTNFKYNENPVIDEALFLDQKRYLIHLKDAYNKGGKPKLFKAAFVGLKFSVNMTELKEFENTQSSLTGSAKLYETLKSFYKSILSTEAENSSIGIQSYENEEYILPHNSKKKTIEFAKRIAVKQTKWARANDLVDISEDTKNLKLESGMKGLFLKDKYNNYIFHPLGYCMTKPNETINNFLLQGVAVEDKFILDAQGVVQSMTTQTKLITKIISEDNVLMGFLPTQQQPTPPTNDYILTYHGLECLILPAHNEKSIKSTAENLKTDFFYSSQDNQIVYRSIKFDKIKVPDNKEKSKSNKYYRGDMKVTYLQYNEYGITNFKYLGNTSNLYALYCCFKKNKPFSQVLTDQQFDEILNTVNNKANEKEVTANLLKNIRQVRPQLKVAVLAKSVNPLNL